MTSQRQNQELDPPDQPFRDVAVSFLCVVCFLLAVFALLSAIAYGIWWVLGLIGLV